MDIAGSGHNDRPINFVYVGDDEDNDLQSEELFSPIEDVGNSQTVRRYFRLGPTEELKLHRRYCTIINPLTQQKCLKHYGHLTGNNALERHLLENHPSEYAIVKNLQSNSKKKRLRSNLNGDKKNDAVQSPTNKQRGTYFQRSIKSAFQSSSNEELLGKFAVVFAKLSLPLHLVENDDFQTLLDSYRSATASCPSVHILKKTQKLEHASLKSIICQRMQNQADPVSVLLDTWTNVNQNAVNNVVIMSNCVPYYWKSIENKYERNTALWMHPHIQNVIQELSELKVKVAGFVVDNATVNLKLFNLLQADFPFLIHIPCHAHIIQLCVKSILMVEGAQEIITWVRKLLLDFKKNLIYRKKLARFQQADGKDGEKGFAPKRLIRPVDTRWNSSLKAAERLLLLQKYIDMIFPDIPQQNWVQLNLLIYLLKPFETATNIIQDDRSTLYDVYTQFLNVLEHLTTYLATRQFFNVKQSYNIIIKYWQSLVNVEAVICCAKFSFDRDYESKFTPQNRQSAKDWFIKFSKNYLNFYYPSTEFTISNIRTQYGQFVSRTGVFIQLHEIIADSTNPKTGKLLPKTIWYNYLDVAPELARCAIAILSLPASEASVERTFSLQSIVHRQHRNRLALPQTETEMFLRTNSHLLTKELFMEPHSVSIVEMDSGSDEDEYKNEEEEVEDNVNFFQTYITEPEIVLFQAIPTIHDDMEEDDTSTTIQSEKYILKRANPITSAEVISTSATKIRIRILRPAPKDTSSSISTKETEAIDSRDNTTSDYRSETSSNIIAIGGKTDRNGVHCCVCFEELDENINWHSCVRCKRNLHGKIICPLGSSMIANDDMLWCSIECYSKSS